MIVMNSFICVWAHVCVPWGVDIVDIFIWKCCILKSWSFLDFMRLWRVELAPRTQGSGGAYSPRRNIWHIWKLTLSIWLHFKRLPWVRVCVRDSVCAHTSGGMVGVDWLRFKDALLKRRCKTLAMFSTIMIRYKHFWINTRLWCSNLTMADRQTLLINGKHHIYRTVLVILKTSLLCCTAWACHNASCISSECWYRNDVLQIFLIVSVETELKEKM